MSNTQRSTVVGVFHDRQKAQRAVDELRKAGFEESHIGVAMRDDAAGSHAVGTTGTTDTAAEAKATNAGMGAAIGAASGMGVGALWAVGIMASLLPAVGPVIFGGGLFAALVASAVGVGAAGGLVGMLVGLGIPEEDAHFYEGEFKGGKTIVTVRAENRADEAWTILSRNGAYDRNTSATSTTEAPRMATATAARTTNTAAASNMGAAASGQTVRLAEEHLEATKRPVHTGDVRVHKEVVTEHKTLDVPVQREEVVITRRPVAGQSANSADIRAGEEIRIPVSEEQVSVQKHAVATEEVTVGKRQVSETKHVEGTVRKEQLKVEQDGNVDVRTSDTNKGRAKN